MILSSAAVLLRGVEVNGSDGMSLGVSDCYGMTYKVIVMRV